MTVGIVGLGLIGGSMAKAYAQAAGIRVLGLDTDKAIQGFAELSGAIHGELDRDTIPDCDLLLLAVYPEAAEAFLREEAPHIAKKTVVIDCLGTKERICALGFRLANEYGFTFVGGHPMAGSEKSGYANSNDHLIENAYYILTPGENSTLEELRTVGSELGLDFDAMVPVIG